MQVLVLMYTNFFIMIYATLTMPFKEKWMQRIIMFNESCLYYLTILLVYFTDITDDYVFQMNVGWCFILIAFICLSVNLWPLIKSTYRVLKWITKRYIRRFDRLF